MKFKEYIKTIQPGESVLIEHTSLSKHPLLFYAIGETCGWNRVLIVDVIDSVLPILRWLRLSGLQVPKDTPRVKAGGVSKWGRLLLEVDPHKDPGIFLSKFTQKLKEYYLKNPGTVTVILNPERMIPLQGNNRRFILSLANLASAFLGNSTRTTFYFVNYEMVERMYLALLEEAFTRVLIVKNEGRVLIAKSPHLEEEGMSLEI
ncbi:DUF257 family protein [Thermococcus thioreducens]|uniref:Uncharacterized protein n=1 Tax=Thermococcus thioreducens TaxID=277988 RepID=A0A0Q2MQG5_9EURY|nr:DUF257 family protein [Thermococcus thioreducens]KQH81919.1 hypothetical protein AMR53_09285 [Thermococcus thioreducens]SEW06247.1 protein of unknown function, DUF257 [Thermococcus thioreducens]